MKKDDYLGLFIRCLGVWEVVHGIGSIPNCFVRVADIRDAALVGSIVHSITGLVLFFAAGYFVEWVYGKRLAQDGDNF